MGNGSRKTLTLNRGRMCERFFSRCRLSFVQRAKVYSSPSECRIKFRATQLKRNYREKAGEFRQNRVVWVKLEVSKRRNFDAEIRDSERGI